MSNPIRLLLVIHNHQPIGNFDGVFEDAYRDSYWPFLETLRDYPEIAISLHNSGSLLEWLERQRPEYIDAVRELTDRGQIEIIGGPFYEPILASIPRRDRIGQIKAYSQHLENLFGQPIQGMWVPERVWEQSFASDIVKAGIGYTILDDYHFKCAGLTDEQLYSYYLTEDEGYNLRVFPGSETLRYTIPFKDPYATIDYLREIAARQSNAVIAFGDDGEKFGTWPGTKEHVYGEGWLRRFFDALRENSEWLKVTTMSEAVAAAPAAGRCYLPDSSYREMTEWALPVSGQVAYENLKHRKQHEDDWSETQQFIRGGFWRNFRVKYSEANDMYARVLEVSERLARMSANEAYRDNTDELNDARRELYRAQCNCSYWHGAFGGLYLPHLRNAVYNCVIVADSILESVQNGEQKKWVDIKFGDFNCDAKQEIRLSNDRLVAYLSPGNGGLLYELDIRSTNHNVLATLNRRPEVYHQKIIEHAQHAGEHSDEAVESIHDLVRFKQPDLDKKIAYDNWPRKSLVDLFLEPGLELEQFQEGVGVITELSDQPFEMRRRTRDDRAEIDLASVANVGSHNVKLTKSIGLDAGRSAIELLYVLEQLPAGETIHFGVEFNFAGMAAGADDRYYYDSEGQKLGQLQAVQTLNESTRIGLVDEWLGLDASLEVSQPAGIWTLPIESISTSEAGLELCHQSSVVIPHWEFVVPADGRWQVELKLILDTSAAQARRLREAQAVSEGSES